jgi:hypothetical protein
MNNFKINSLLLTPPVFKKANFMYFTYNLNNIVYLIDIIQTKDNNYLLRVLESNAFEKKYPVYWFSLMEEKTKFNIEKEGILNVSNVSGFYFECNIFPLSIKILEKDFEYNHFYLPFLPYIFSYIPNLKSKLLTKTHIKSNLQSYSNNIIMANYSLKNIYKSKWIYLVAFSDTSYFELAISSILGFKGVVWVLDIPNRNILEKHNTIISFSKLKSVKKELISSENLIKYDFVIGLRNEIIIKIQFDKDSFKTIWANKNNSFHTIKTTLEAKIALKINKKGQKLDLNWQQSLFEVNNNIT